MSQSSALKQHFTSCKINGKVISRGLIIVAMGIVTGFFLYTVLHKNFETDEAEGLAAATSILNGQVPYRDFYEIHTPLFYYFLSLTCLFYNSMKVIIAVRFEIFLLTLLNGFLIFKIIKRFLPTDAALLGVLSYLTCVPIFYDQIRPDILVGVFSDLSLWLLINEDLPASGAFFGAGLSAALAVLTKQSGAFCIISILILFFVRLVLGSLNFWEKTIFNAARFNLKHYAFFLGGLLLPLGLFYLYLSGNRAWDSFIQCAINNDFLNVYLSRDIHSVHWYPFACIQEMFKSNYLLFIMMAFLPIFLLIQRSALGIKNISKYIILVFFAMVSFGSLFKILHPWPQELILPSQYLVLLSIAPFYFVYQNVFDYFEEQNLGILGFILDLVLVKTLCLSPLIHPFYTSGFNLLGEDTIIHRDRIIFLTNKEDKIFSAIPIPYRPSVYYLRIGYMLIESPQLSKRVEDDLIKEILNSRVVVIFPEDRYNTMNRLIALINANYTLIPYGFFVPGSNFESAKNKESQWDVIVDGYYRIQNPISGILLDNKPLFNNLVYLAKGQHRILFPGNPFKGLNNKTTCLIYYDLMANKKAS